MFAGGAQVASGQSNLDKKLQRGKGPKFCPGNGDRSWNATKAIVGKRLPAARKIARRNDCAIRVVKKDGKSRVVTSDLLFHRLNVAIVGKDRRVVRIVSVG